MKTAFFLFLLLPSLLFAADTGSYKYFLSKEKKYKEVQIKKHAGVNISANCFKKNGSVDCEAWRATRKKANDPDRKDIGVVGNPAALYCSSYKSRNLIFLNSKKQEYDFCLFSDGSAIDAWDLYNTHHK